MSFLPTGTVYGTLLNFRREYDALAPRMAEAPYKAPPQAPVLYIKPANTWTPDGGSIAIPTRGDGGIGEVTIGATLAIVIGPKALARSAADPIDSVAGYVLMNDLSLPQPDYFRPPVKYNCVDGFLGIGEQLMPMADAGDLASLTLDVRIDGALRQQVRLADLVRTTLQLLAEVGDFMTLHPGDVLMLGTDVLEASDQRLMARAGQRIDISAPGFSTLSNALVAEVA